MRYHVALVGTSAISTFAGRVGDPKDSEWGAAWLTPWDHAVVQGDQAQEWWAAANESDVFTDSLPGGIDDGFCAELSTLLATGEDCALQPGDDLTLLCSDTTEGVISGLLVALLLSRHLRDNLGDASVCYTSAQAAPGDGTLLSDPQPDEAGFVVRVVRVADLDPRSIDSFPKGLANLARAVMQVVGMAEAADEYHIHLSGGFKVVTAHVGTLIACLRSYPAGQMVRCRMWSRFEGRGAVIQVPTVGIINATELHREVQNPAAAVVYADLLRDAAGHATPLAWALAELDLA